MRILILSILHLVHTMVIMDILFLMLQVYLNFQDFNGLKI